MSSSAKCPPETPLEGAPTTMLARVTAVLHRIIGVPDYERYVAHMQLRHPDAVLLTREAFLRERLADRYSKPGSRCC